MQFLAWRHTSATISTDPTSACNLRCTGCWAAEYGHSLSLTLEELDGIIRQGEEFGCHVYLYSGGEPTMRKADLNPIYDDVVYHLFNMIREYLSTDWSGKIADGLQRGYLM